MLTLFSINYRKGSIKCGKKLLNLQCYANIMPCPVPKQVYYSWSLGLKAIIAFPCILGIAFHYFLLTCFSRFCGLIGTAMCKLITAPCQQRECRGKEAPSTLAFHSSASRGTSAPLLLETPPVSNMLPGQPHMNLFHLTKLEYSPRI